MDTTTTTTTTATAAAPLPPVALSTSFQDFLASESDSLDSFHGLAFLAPLNPLHNQRISSAAFAQSFLPSSSPTHSSMSLSASSLSASSAYAYTSLNNCDFPSLNLNFSLPHESSSENLYGFDSSLDFSQSLNNDIPTTPNFPSRENSNSSSSDNNSLSPLSDTTSPTLTPPNSAEEYILSNVDDLLEDQLRPQQTGSLAAPAVAGHSSCKEEATPTMAMALRVNPITAKVLVSTHSTASSSSSSSSSSSASSSSNSMSMNAKPILSQSGKRKKRAAPSDDEDKEEFPSPKSECSVEEEKECKKSCLPRGLLYHADAHVHDRPPNKFLEFCPAHRAWNALDYEGIFYIGLSTKVNGSNITALKSETLKSGITWRQPFTLLSPSVAAKGYTLFILGVGSKLRPAYVAKLKGKIRFEQSLPSEAKCRRCRLKAEVLEWTLLDQGEDREAATFHQQLENVLRGKEANSAPASRAKKQRNERTAVSTLVDENEDKNDVTVNEELLAFHAHMQLALRPPAPPPPSSSSSSSSVSAPSHGSSHELMSFSEYYSRLLKLFLVFHVYAHSNAVSLRSLATALHLDDCVDDQQLFMRLATALQQLQLQGQSMYENWQQMRSFELLAELMAQHLRTQAVTLDQIRTYHRQANIILRTQAQGRRVCRNWLGGCYHRMAVGDSELCAECSVQYQQQQPAAQQRLPAIFLFARNVQTSDSVLWQEMWNPERHTQFAIFAFAAANNIWMRRWSASECDSDELLMIAFNPMRGVDSTPFDGCGAVYALVDIALHAVNVMTSSTSGSGILAAVEQSERRLLSLAEFQSLARAQQFFSYRQSQPLHQFSQSTSASSSSSSSFPHSGHANENAIDDGGQMATVNATAMTLVQVNNEDVGVSGGHEDGSQQFVQRRVQGAPHDNQAITDITVLEPHGSVPLVPINNRVTQLVEPQQANLLNTQAQNRFTFQIQRNSMEDEGTENNPEIRQREQYYQQMQSMLSQARRSATNTHAASTANGNDEHYASQTAGSQQPRLFSAVNVEESNGSPSTSLSSSASTHMVEVGSASGHAQFQSSFAVQSESDVSHSTNAADRHHQQLSAPLQLPISRIEFSPWPHYDSHAHNQIHRSRRFQSLTQLQVAEFSATSDAQQIPQLSLAPTPLQPQMHIQTQISPAQTQQEMLSSETRTLSVSSGFASDSDSDSVSRMNVSLSQTESSDIPRAQQDSGPLENRGSSGVGQRHSSRSSAAGNHSGNFLGAGVSSEPSTAGSGIGVGAILTQLALVTSWFSSKAEQSLALLLVLVSSSLVQQQAAEPQVQQIHHLPPLSDNHAQILLTPTHSHTDGDLQSSFSQSHNPQSFQHTQTDPDIQQSIRFQSADVSWITSEQMYSLHTQQPPALHSNMFSITPQRISSSRANESSSQSSSARAISANALTWLAAAVSWFSVQAKQSAAIFVVVLSTAAQQQQQRSQQQSNSAHGHVPFTNANAASTRMSMQNPDSREERSQLQSQLEAQSASEQWQQSSSHSASQSSGEHLQKKKEPRNKQSEQENRIYEEYRLPKKAGTVTKHWAQSLQSAVNNSETVSAQILALAQNSQTRKPQNSADTIRGRGTMSLQRALKLLIAALKRAKISTVSVHDDEQCFASEISDQLTVDDRTHSDGFERQRVEEDSDFNNVHCAFDRNPWQTSVCAAVA